MLKKFLHVILCSAICSNSMTGLAQSPAYEKVWESKSELRSPVALAFDSRKKVYYVANKNKSVLDEGYSYTNRMDGFISKVSEKGEIIDLKWIEGLEEPSDVHIKGNELFVTDGDNFVIIDIAKGEIVKRVPTSEFVDPEKSKIVIESIDSPNKSFPGPPPERSMLEAIASSADGRVFVLDEGTGSVYEWANGKFAVFVKDNRLADTNKLIWDEETNSLFALDSNRIYTISLNEKAITRFSIYRAAPAQGIARVNGGYLIITSFNKIFQLMNHEVSPLFSTGDACRCTTDIQSAPDGKSITVLVSSLNKLINYKLK